jgi:undecaprenyl phosphate-alpha-L-ara4N flippase subunit ArnE
MYPVWNQSGHESESKINGTEIALTLASVLCSTAGQVAFKSASVRVFPGAFLFWCGGAAFMLASMLIVVMVLRTVPLSALVPFAALAYVTVPLASMLIFKEVTGKRFWLGTLCIIIGVIFTLI